MDRFTFFFSPMHLYGEASTLDCDSNSTDISGCLKGSLPLCQLDWKHTDFILGSVALASRTRKAARPPQACCRCCHCWLFNSKQNKPILHWLRRFLCQTTALNLPHCGGARVAYSLLRDHRLRSPQRMLQIIFEPLETEDNAAAAVTNKQRVVGGVLGLRWPRDKQTTRAQGWEKHLSAPLNKCAGKRHTGLWQLVILLYF